MDTVSSCLAMMDTLIMQTAAKFQTKIYYYRIFTEINSHNYGLSLIRTLAWGLFSAAKESWQYNVLDIPGVAMIFRTGGWHCCTPRVLARLGAWGQRQALRLCPEKNWKVPWICVIQGIQYMISNYEKFLESDFLVTEEEKLDARGHWALLKHIHEAAK